jgi:ABC-2 type transport system ATP-binding protein
VNTIDVKNLRRIFRPTTGIWRRKKKEIVAVDEISFAIKKGELFGLLGPNGAGKTTTVKMLTTLLLPTSGDALVAGYSVVNDQRQVQRKIGFIFGGERGLYWRLSAEDNLRYFASLYHVDTRVTKHLIPKLLDLVGLSGREKEKVEGYSRSTIS